MARALWGLFGMLLAGYGALLLTRMSSDALIGIAVWWAGGVVLHDLVLVPLIALAGWGLARVLPRHARRMLAWWFLLAGPLTLLAVPVLGRFGARADNPTLLDRPYVAGWLGLVALLAVAVVLVGLVVGKGTESSARSSAAG